MALLKTVDLGFNEYEGGSWGDSQKEFLEFCTGISIKPIAGGINFTEDLDPYQKQFDKLNNLKMEYAVIYWPWLKDAPFKLEDCKKSSDLLNQIGFLAHNNGLKLCWHNHANEFFEMEEGLPFDYLMLHTEKKYVRCEMDIYWVTKGGADAVKILKQYSGRIPMLHIKDMAADVAKTITCPGSGIIDFPAILGEARKQKIAHYFVECDNAPDGMSCLKTSSDFLKALRF
jgi:sugar phosphate isomerase/epimerase